MRLQIFLNHTTCGGKRNRVKYSIKQNAMLTTFTAEWVPWISWQTGVHPRKANRPALKPQRSFGFAKSLQQAECGTICLVRARTLPKPHLAGPTPPTSRPGACNCLCPDLCKNSVDDRTIAPPAIGLRKICAQLMIDQEKKSKSASS